MVIKIICLGLTLFLLLAEPQPIFELEENQRLKEENNWLKDIITKNISDLAEQITSVRTEYIENIDYIKTDLTLDVPIGKVD